MISVCIVAYNRDAMLARTLPLVKAAALNAQEDVELVAVTSGPGKDATYALCHDVWGAGLDLCGCIRLEHETQFSAGAYRNLAANAAKGDVLVMLDADMAVPPTFLADMARIVRGGQAAFPLYLREDHPGGHQSPGNGYGNSAFSRDVWATVSALKRGAPYPELTRWGHEDVAFAKLVTRVAPMWRRLVPGFVHLWHPKTGSQWYGAPGVGGVQRGKG